MQGVVAYPSIAIRVHGTDESRNIFVAQKQGHVVVREMQKVLQVLANCCNEGANEHLVAGAIGSPQQHGARILVKEPNKKRVQVHHRHTHVGVHGRKCLST
jgi:hypothetical protein